MNEPLALKYRPKSFSDLVGQKINAVVLDQMVRTNSVPAGLLFSGPSGVGKTSAARILAAAMHASDVIEVDAASNGGVAEVRKLIEATRYGTGGGTRVIILDEAHSITRQGFEVLLKTLEEPPPGNVFVLVTTEPYKIPDTILSRLVEFQFRAVTTGEIYSRLMSIGVWEDLTISNELTAHLAQRSEGNVRKAIQSLDMAVRAGVDSVAEYVALTGEHDPAPALLAALTTGQHDRIFSLLDEQLATVGSPSQIQSLLVSCLRDLFVLKAGGDLTVTGVGLEARRDLARRIEQERLLYAVKTLWETKTRIRTSDDPRGNLELALILISEAFTRGRVVQQPPPEPQSVVEAKAPEKRLTLAEMQSSKRVS